MVAGAQGDTAHFTLSIEAAEGVSTGISAADRAHTVRVAVAPTAQPADVVQPGHIFPLTARPGGVLTRAGHTEAATDYARLAGMLPAAVIADVLDSDGNLAGAAALQSFASQHGLRMGSIADLIDFRLRTERTIERIREGFIQTAHGRFDLFAYRELTTGMVHLALRRGAVTADQPTLARVHVGASLRDLIGAQIEGRSGWTLQRSLAAIAAAEQGVLVLISRPESAEQLLASLELVLGSGQPYEHVDSYNNVGLGCQILRDLGVGRLRLMGAPIKYNALSGFGLQLEEFVAL
jgi:3,4-dihydroxy 2-butanone 4-phosphate synthase/GTP cyclohydrolase II